MSEELDRLFREAGEVLASHIEIPPERLAAGAHERARALRSEAPRFRRRMNRGLFGLGVPVLALYRALTEEAGLAEEAALAAIEAMLQKAYEVRLRSPIKRRVASWAFRLPVLQGALLHMAEGAREEDGGFVMRRVEEEGTLLALDVERCPLALFFAEQGAPEVGPLICKIDDLMAEALPGVRLERSGTIANGAARCDFRYRRE